MVLIAYKHETRNKALHLRVEQSLFSTAMKDDVVIVGKGFEVN